MELRKVVNTTVKVTASIHFYFNSISNFLLIANMSCCGKTDLFALRNRIGFKFTHQGL